ncbi:MAG: nitroreductase family deazaflavin-dependent oxidoreductase [Caldilineaceae bacterium]
MNTQIQQALRTDQVIDITTKGRKSGEPRRIEIWFHNVDDRIYITGTPGKRNWYANLTANPHFTFHLKESIQADLPATARPITDPAERRTVLARITQKLNQTLNRTTDLETWVADSPLVEVTFDSLPS